MLDWIFFSGVFGLAFDQAGARPKKKVCKEVPLQQPAEERNQPRSLEAQSAKWPGPSRPGYFQIGDMWIEELQEAPSSEEATSEEILDLSTEAGIRTLQKEQARKCLLYILYCHHVLFSSFFCRQYYKKMALEAKPAAKPMPRNKAFQSKPSSSTVAPEADGVRTPSKQPTQEKDLPTGFVRLASVMETFFSN